MLCSSSFLLSKRSLFSTIFNVLNGTTLFELPAFVDNVFVFIASSFGLIKLHFIPIVIIKWPNPFYNFRMINLKTNPAQ
jgi:hypothetical protein